MVVKLWNNDIMGRGRGERKKRSEKAGGWNGRVNGEAGMVEREGRGRVG